MFVLACSFAVAPLASACRQAGSPGTQQSRAPAVPSTSSLPGARGAVPGAPESDGANVAQPPTQRVEVALADYEISPAVSSVDAGQVTLDTVNNGRVGHNVAVVATTLPSDNLPITGVRLNESDPSIVIVGKTPSLAAGGRSTLTVDLGPGTYLLVCTVPHHYVRERMLATLTVEA